MPSRKSQLASFACAAGCAFDAIACATNDSGTSCGIIAGMPSTMPAESVNGIALRSHFVFI